MSDSEESSNGSSEAAVPEGDDVEKSKFNRIVNGNARVRIREPESTATSKDDKEILAEEIKAVQGTENVAERYAEIVRLRKKYIHVEGRTGHTHKFYFKDRDNALAFETKKNMVQSEVDDSYVSKDMVRYAANSGWKTVSIEGSDRFKSEVWHDASLKGIEVKGYSPTDLDKAKLRDSQDRETTNRPLTENGKAAVTKVKNVLRTRGDSETVIDAVGDEAEKRLSRESTIVGRVEKTGYDEYVSGDKNSQTYFVDMRTDGGEKRLWGTHLKELVDKGVINKGDEIAIEFNGRRETQIPERDENGKKTGEWRQAYRNEYSVYDLAKVEPNRAKKMRDQDRARTSDPQIGKERVIDKNERDTSEELEERSVAIER